jgi:hypothetical protein
MNEQNNNEEVARVDDPKNKAKRMVPFHIHLSSNPKTGRQKKAHARTLAMVTDPKNVANDPPHIDTRSNKGRNIRRKRAAARRKATEKSKNTQKNILS